MKEHGDFVRFKGKVCPASHPQPDRGHILLVEDINPIILLLELHRRQADDNLKISHFSDLLRLFFDRLATAFRLQTDEGLILTLILEVFQRLISCHGKALQRKASTLVTNGPCVLPTSTKL